MISRMDGNSLIRPDHPVFIKVDASCSQPGLILDHLSAGSKRNAVQPAYHYLESGHKTLKISRVKEYLQEDKNRIKFLIKFNFA